MSAMSRSKVSSWLIETRSTESLERPRVDPARAVAQHRPDLAGKEPLQRRHRRARRARRSSRCRPGRAALGLRADAGQLAHGERREERGLPARRHDGQPAGLARGRSPPWPRPCRTRRRASTSGRSRRARPPAPPPATAAGLQEVARRPRRGRGSPRRGRCARRSARPRARHPRPPASTRGRPRAGAGRRPPAGSAAAPRRSSSPSGCRTRAPRSSPWRRLPARAGRRRRRAASRGAPGPRAPRRRRRTRRGRGARRSRARSRRSDDRRPRRSALPPPIHVAADQLAAAEHERGEHHAEQRLVATSGLTTVTRPR